MKFIPLIFPILFLLACEQQIKPGKAEPVAQKTIEDAKLLEKTPIAQPDSLDIDFQFRAGCYAYSSYKNAQKSNGEAHSSNLPKEVGDKFHRKGFYLLINEKERVNLSSSVLGCKLYLVNTTASAVEMEAADSRLNIIAEALDGRNKWVPISYLPNSFCGNSYHTVVLDQDEYWSFDIPFFTGNTKTKLRYTLDMEPDDKISSNEIDVYLNEGQFDSTNRQGHRSRNLMDPYTE